MKKKDINKYIMFSLFLSISIFWIYLVITFIGPIVNKSLTQYIFANPVVENKEYLSEITNTDTNFIDSSSSLSTEYVEKTTSTDSKIYITDPRVVAMRKFLIDYNSPMYAYADVFIYEADKNKLDWRLVASISGVESGFGNVSIVPNNSWGWKGGPNNTWSYFKSYREGIETVSVGLGYWYKGLTPYQIEERYCPDCFEGGNYAWANGVQNNMNELDYYLKNLESL